MFLWLTCLQCSFLNLQLGSCHCHIQLSCVFIYQLHSWSVISSFFFFFFFEILFIYLFYFTLLYWFCHTSTWIRHGCTCVPNPEPSSHLPPHTIPLGHPSALAPSILYPASNLVLGIRFLYDIIHVSMSFSQIIPPSPSPRVQKTVLYICVSFALSLTGLSLPSF